MSYTSTLQEAQAILASLKQQQDSLGQPISPDGITLIEGVLQSLIKDAKPNSIECAVRARQVAFVRTSRTAYAQDIERQLTLNRRLWVVYPEPHIVQFWPVDLPVVVPFFRVEQVSPFKKVIGEVYALSGADARDLLAANAGFVAHEPGKVIETHGHKINVPGKPLLDSDRAYYRSCKAVAAGSIEQPQSWVSSIIGG